MPRRASRTLLGSTAILLVIGTTGCGITIPTDPDGTLERVRGGALEVGISSNKPWTDVSESAPRGIEVDLVDDFAATLDAEVDWHEGGEESLIGSLERGELDLVVGGLTDASPWAGKAAITKPFVEAAGPDGGTEKHVMAAPLGENAFLLELESFLLSQKVEAP